MTGIVEGRTDIPARGLLFDARLTGIITGTAINLNEGGEINMACEDCEVLQKEVDKLTDEKADLETAVEELEKELSDAEAERDNHKDKLNEIVADINYRLI